MATLFSGKRFIHNKLHNELLNSVHGAGDSMAAMATKLQPPCTVAGHGAGVGISPFGPAAVELLVATGAMPLRGPGARSAPGRRAETWRVVDQFI